jgi:succinate dehydrogenase / fumarate reductase cytochrome b subunit
MSLTGLFIAFFLIIHLLGNLQLIFISDPVEAQLQYNWYSELLSHNIIIEIIAYLLYASLILHVVDALYITLQNRKANGPGLKKDTRGQVSGWHKRNMGILGVVILIFLIIHLKDYWYVYKFDESYTGVDSAGKRDVYTLVMVSFEELWYIILYIIGFIGLGYHLAHGVASGFRTLGLYNRSYIKIMKYLGIAFAIIIPLGYAIIPVIIYLKNM